MTEFFWGEKEGSDEIQTEVKRSLKLPKNRGSGIYLMAEYEVTKKLIKQSIMHFQIQPGEAINDIFKGSVVWNQWRKSVL